jgi:hypothetical protein
MIEQRRRRHGDPQFSVQAHCCTPGNPIARFISGCRGAQLLVDQRRRLLETEAGQRPPLTNTRASW